jgi:hypothetical protein
MEIVHGEGRSWKLEGKVRSIKVDVWGKMSDQIQKVHSPEGMPPKGIPLTFG